MTAEPLPLALCDGAVVPLADATVVGHDRTVTTGVGAFETMRVVAGRAWLGDRHLARLLRSLAAVRCEAPPGLAGLLDGIAALALACKVTEAVARITVTAGPDNGIGRVLVHLRPLPAAPRRPVVVGVADFAHDPRSPLAGVKSTSYLVHVLLRDRALAAGRLEDLLVDSTGRVTEGTVSNVFGVRAGTLITPPLEEGILPGVTRGFVLESARELGIEAQETPLQRSDLALLDEAFVTGAVKGLVDVDVLDGRELPPDRPVFSQLERAYRERVEAFAAGP